MKYIIDYGFICDCKVIGTIEVVAASKAEAIRKAKLDRNKVYKVIRVQAYRRL